VTAILPHGDNLYAEKVPAACHVINGYGKATGLTQLAEIGTLESPVLLTNTLAVGAVWEGGLRHVLEQNPEAARDGDTVNVVVGECFDGWLSDARALPVRPEHALEAIAAASGEPPAEGGVGAGTGTTCFGFKAGVGSSSRTVEGGFALGCLVVSNFGARRDLHMLVGTEAAGAPTGKAPADPEGGSIMIVLGTDAPLSDRQLRRVAARTTFGLGRAGSFASSGSGEYAIAFSTGSRIPHRAKAPTLEPSLLRDDSRELRELFEAAGEATQEAILNSLCVAEAADGREGRRVDAFPHELLPAALGLKR
jgi:D-aminopeptidase